MSSLFDIAAGLSQFDTGGDEDPWTSAAKDAASDESSTPEQDFGSEHNSELPHNRAHLSIQRRQSALCILDETLQTIYDTRRSSPVTPLSSLSASKSSEQLENRLQQLNATTSASLSSLSRSGSASELRNVYSHSIAYQQQLEVATSTPRAELKPSRATTNGSSKPHGSQSGDPDMFAKTVLREIGDEIEQFMAATSHDHRTPAQRDATARFLTEKYIDARLNKLPGTPFVQLARRKALQKIQQFSQSEVANTQSSVKAAASTASPSPQQNQQQLQDASELLQKLSALTPSHREMLQKLTRVPEAQVSSLPQAQRELVQFAKRLERARAMSAQELSHLEPSHLQLVRKLQQSE